MFPDKKIYHKCFPYKAHQQFIYAGGKCFFIITKRLSVISHSIQKNRL